MTRHAPAVAMLGVAGLIALGCTWSLPLALIIIVALVVAVPVWWDDAR